MFIHNEVENYSSIKQSMEEKQYRKYNKNCIVIHMTDIPLIQKDSSSAFIDDYMYNFKDTEVRSHICIGMVSDHIESVKMIPYEYSTYNACGNGDLGSIGRESIDIVSCVPRTYDFAHNYDILEYADDLGYAALLFNVLTETVANVIKETGIGLDRVFFHQELYKAGLACKKPDMMDYFNYKCDQLTMQYFRSMVAMQLGIEPPTNHLESLNENDTIYRIILSKHDQDETLERRLESIGYKYYTYQQFDNFFTYQVYASTSEEEAKTHKSELIKMGYPCMITTETPVRDRYDQRLVCKRRTFFTRGDYETLVPCKMYKDPILKTQELTIPEGYMIENVTTDCIFNGYNSSWIYLKDDNKYICIQEGDQPYVVKK